MSFKMWKVAAVIVILGAGCSGTSYTTINGAQSCTSGFSVESYPSSEIVEISNGLRSEALKLHESFVDSGNSTMIELGNALLDTEIDRVIGQTVDEEWVEVRGTTQLERDVSGGEFFADEDQLDINTLIDVDSLICYISNENSQEPVTFRKTRTALLVEEYLGY